MKFLGFGAAAISPIAAWWAHRPGHIQALPGSEPMKISLREHTTYDSYDGPLTAHQRQLGKSMARMMDEQIIKVWREQLIREAKADSQFLKFLG